LTKKSVQNFAVNYFFAKIDQTTKGDTEGEGETGGGRYKISCPSRKKGVRKGDEKKHHETRGKANAAAEKT